MVGLVVGDAKNRVEAPSPALGTTPRRSAPAADPSASSARQSRLALGCARGRRPTRRSGSIGGTGFWPLVQDQVGTRVPVRC
jgi:hypothetical protein